MKPIVAALALLSIAGLAGAQTTVWRCGDAGRDFGDRRCESGQAMVVADARDADEVAAARAVAARERSLAERLVRERQQREREQAGGLAGIRGTPHVARDDRRSARPDRDARRAPVRETRIVRLARKPAT